MKGQNAVCAPCWRSRAEMEKVPARRSSGAVLGPCGPSLGERCFLKATGPGVSDSQAGERPGVTSGARVGVTMPGNAGRMRDFRAPKLPDLRCRV